MAFLLGIDGAPGYEGDYRLLKAGMGGGFRGSVA